MKNFNDFPPHIEVYPRLKFCALARGPCPPDPRIPSFSYGTPMIFLPILRSTLGSNFAHPRCGSGPWTPKSFIFLRIFMDFPPHTEVYPPVVGNKLVYNLPMETNMEQRAPQKTSKKPKIPDGLKICTKLVLGSYRTHFDLVLTSFRARYDPPNEPQTSPKRAPNEL